MGVLALRRDRPPAPPDTSPRRTAPRRVPRDALSSRARGLPRYRVSPSVCLILCSVVKSSRVPAAAPAQQCLCVSRALGAKRSPRFHIAHAGAGRLPSAVSSIHPVACTSLVFLFPGESESLQATFASAGCAVKQCGQGSCPQPVEPGWH